MKFRLLLAGYKGYKFLEKIVKDNYTIDFIESVVSYKGKNKFFGDIEKICNEENITLYLRSELDVLKYKEHLINLTIGWQYIITGNTDDVIIFHDSLLPLYRGWNPTVTALINGDGYAGTTALLPGYEFDCGHIIDQYEYEIVEDMTIREAYEEVTHCNVLMFMNLRSHFEETNELPKAVPQNEVLATYSIWKDKEDYLIDWNWSAEKIVRFINAVGFPYEGATSLGIPYEGDDYPIIEEAMIYYPEIKIVNNTPGKIFEFNEQGYPVVTCGKGMVSIEKMTINGERFEWYPQKIRYKLR